MKIAAIVLAAGLSRRMGVLKPLLPVGGESAVLRCVRTLNGAGIQSVFIVTGSRSRDVEVVFSVQDAPAVQFIHNKEYHNGMYSSIIAGARGLPDGFDGFFLLPADCCAVSCDTLLLQLEKFAETCGERVIRPKLDNLRGHPPLIPAKFKTPLLNYDGRDGMRGFLNTCPFTAVYPNDPGVLLDMDTPEDYAQLLEYLELPAYPGEDACARLFKKYNTPPDIIEHGQQVADLALELAQSIADTGAQLNLNLLRSICLLHDIARREPEHAQAGRRLLLLEGYPKAAIAVGAHMDGSGGDIDNIGESELLFLADKLCRKGRRTSLSDTRKSLEDKFRGDTEAMSCAKTRIDRAERILSVLKERFGVDCAEFL